MRPWFQPLLFVPVAAFAFGAGGTLDANSRQTDRVAPSTDGRDGVALSFAVFGCNRVDKADTAGNISTANVAELSRTLADIAALKPRPRFLFFAGDEVFGFTSDTVRLARELAAWRRIYEASPLARAGVELVALPGNHEMQNNHKHAYEAAERTWLRVMAPYTTRGGNGPKAGGLDHLATDQSRLSYSFDVGTTHFVVLNTDPAGDDSHVPTNWVRRDLTTARARGAQHIFVIGHKPAYPYPTAPTDGLSIDPAARDSFWNVLDSAGADAMIAAHNHVWYRSRPTSAKTWMIIAGNGGSRLDQGLDPSLPTTGEYYGFTLISITDGGRVIERSYGRDVPPSSYLAGVATEKTTVRDSIDLSQ